MGRMFCSWSLIPRMTAEPSSAAHTKMTIL
ncbi:Uncharacterised protein [Bordetella pertussis]|nr:Uncharacterised protein [Bordetella pertussis]